jgi:hypothetical protein
MWKRGAWPNVNQYSGISLKKLKKTIIIFRKKNKQVCFPSAEPTTYPNKTNPYFR